MSTYQLHLRAAEIAESAYTDLQLKLDTFKFSLNEDNTNKLLEK